MNSPHYKLSGLNLWFIIEILSFYGYILSAMLFILEYSIKSSLGILAKPKDAYKFDFLAYFRKDCDWLAFVTILQTVNLGIMLLDQNFINEERREQGREEIHFNTPLSKLMWQLLANHFLQMLFLRNFYDDNREVNTKNKWVWGIHAINYPYILYVYCFTDAVKVDNSELRKIWIPLDIILTINITLY